MPSAPRCPVCNGDDKAACYEANHISLCSTCGQEYISLVYENCLNCNNFNDFITPAQHMQQVNRDMDALMLDEQPLFESPTASQTQSQVGYTYTPAPAPGPASASGSAASAATAIPPLVNPNSGIPRPERMASYRLLRRAGVSLGQPSFGRWPSEQNIKDSNILIECANALMLAARDQLRGDVARDACEWLEEYRQRTIQMGHAQSSVGAGNTAANWLQEFVDELRVVWVARIHEVPPDPPLVFEGMEDDMDVDMDEGDGAGAAQGEDLGEDLGEADQVEQQQEQVQLPAQAEAQANVPVPAPAPAPAQAPAPAPTPTPAAPQPQPSSRSEAEGEAAAETEVPQTYQYGDYDDLLDLAERIVDLSKTPRKGLPKGAPLPSKARLQQRDNEMRAAADGYRHAALALSNGENGTLAFADAKKAYDFVNAMKKRVVVDDESEMETHRDVQFFVRYERALVGMCKDLEESLAPPLELH